MPPVQHPKHAHNGQHQGQHQGQHGQNHENLSEEDRKILEDAHANRTNPNHPAHEKHPEHGSFLKSIPKRLGGAAIFGAGAKVGSAAIGGLMGN